MSWKMFSFSCCDVTLRNACPSNFGVEKLVEFGISSVSSNTDAIADVRKTVARAEQKIILDAARKRME